MKYEIGKSKSNNPEMCVKEVCSGFTNPKLIIYYSTVDHFDEYTKLIAQKFPESICLGATTLVEITKDGADKTGLMAIGIESGITCSADVLEYADTYPIKYVERIENCVKKVGKSSDSVCLEFTTAFRCAEESVLATLNSVLLNYNIPVFGGTAGDDTSGINTFVGLNGKVYENSAVFAIIHNEGGKIHYFRENIYKPSNGHVLVATKVDPVKRTVMEYNHEPATKVYAKELGVDESQIKNYLDTHPMGRIVGDEMYITANCAPTNNHGMTYHARIYNNSRVILLEPDAYRNVIEDTIEKIKREVPKPSFSIMCHCLARTLLFEGEGYLQEYVKKMGDVLGDYVGFSGYGEQMGRHQFNQTMALIIFE